MGLLTTIADGTALPKRWFFQHSLFSAAHYGTVQSQIGVWVGRVGDGGVACLRAFIAPPHFWRERHETSPPHILASGRRHRRAAGGRKHCEGAILSIAAGAHCRGL